MKNAMLMLLVILSVAGCKMKEGPTQDPGKKGIPVTLAQVRIGTGENTLKYSGSVEASQTIPLYFQTTGTVEKVLVETGDAVKKGDLLAVLDQSDLKNILAMSESKLAQAQDAYDRLRKVHDQGSLPEIKWVEMETNLAQAKSSVEIAKNNLDKCFMRAPSDGIIGRRNIEPGMIPLTIGTVPVELVDIREVNVKIPVPENEISKMRKGMKATILVGALDNGQFEGTVSGVTPVADKLSRTYEVRIAVNNPGLMLKPGMICDVSLGLPGTGTVMLIPYQSVMKDASGISYVFVADPATGKVKKQPVTTGNFSDNQLVVLEGVTPGQWVVKEGKEKLSDNTSVVIRHE